VQVPADLTNSPQAHQEIRRWLWAVLLATGARALATAGRWADASARLADYNGIGRRMLDGRQVAVIAHAVAGEPRHALTLLADTTPGEPWENAVTACLTILCQEGSDIPDLAKLLAPYYAVDTTAPGLAVFHTRLGLSYLDAIGTADDQAAQRISTQLTARATTVHDGYVARDVLAHNRCREYLTQTQTRDLTDLVETCGLGRGALPASVLADFTIALASAEEVMARKAGDIHNYPAVYAPEWLPAGRVR
jgi:hypothetical protein